MTATVYGVEDFRDARVAALLPDERTRTLVLTLAAAVDAKGGYTPSHCHGVARLSHTIGRYVGIRGEHATRLYTAGLLHDVGKLHVPDSILLAPRKLTDSEFDVIRQHPEASHSMLRALGLPQEARWALHHHEAADGSGYPSGLQGAGIPRESRIILLADAFDVMCSNRPYRAAMTAREAFREIRDHTPDQFDPELVDALERVIFAAGCS